MVEGRRLTGNERNFLLELRDLIRRYYLSIEIIEGDHYSRDYFMIRGYDINIDLNVMNIEEWVDKKIINGE